MVAMNKVQEKVFEVIQSGILLIFYFLFYLYKLNYSHKVINGLQIMCILDKSLSINQVPKNLK